MNDDAEENNAVKNFDFFEVVFCSGIVAKILLYMFPITWYIIIYFYLFYCIFKIRNLVKEGGEGEIFCFE